MCTNTISNLIHSISPLHFSSHIHCLFPHFSVLLAIPISAPFAGLQLLSSSSPMACLGYLQFNGQFCTKTMPRIAITRARHSYPTQPLFAPTTPILHGHYLHLGLPHLHWILHLPLEALTDHALPHLLLHLGPYLPELSPTISATLLHLLLAFNHLLNHLLTQHHYL